MSAAFDARLGPAAVAPVKPHLDRPLDIRLALILLAVLALGLFYMAYSIRSDLSASGGGPGTRGAVSRSIGAQPAAPGATSGVRYPVTGSRLAPCRS